MSLYVLERKKHKTGLIYLNKYIRDKIYVADGSSLLLFPFNFKLFQISQFIFAFLAEIRSYTKAFSNYSTATFKPIGR